MSEVICPNCKKAFKIDEAGYADILKQVHDTEFDKQLQKRLALAEQDKNNAIELAKEKFSGQLRDALSEKHDEISKLKAELSNADIKKSLAITAALKVVEKERDELHNALEKAKKESEAISKLEKVSHQSQLQETAAKKDAEILKLKARLSAAESLQKHTVAEAQSSAERELGKLKSELDKAHLEKKLSEQSLKDKYETQLKDRDEAIERLRDMKAKLSTKMVGESLEQHCETEFNRIRHTAFPRAYFEKDNDARGGSKGDYIF